MGESTLRSELDSERRKRLNSKPWWVAGFGIVATSVGTLLALGAMPRCDDLQRTSDAANIEKQLRKEIIATQAANERAHEQLYQMHRDILQELKDGRKEWKTALDTIDGRLWHIQQGQR